MTKYPCKVSIIKYEHNIDISLIIDGISERLVDGQNLLTHLEGCGKLSENNFDDLKSLLDDVYRRDLIRKIEDWSIDEGLKIWHL